MPFVTEDLLRATPLSDRPVLLIGIMLASWILTHHLMKANDQGSGDVKSKAQLCAPEPPSAASKIPIFGHIYGLVTKRLEYVTALNSSSLTGICTLAFPFLPRIYIVTSLAEVHDVQKNAKLASFSAVGSRVCSKLGGVSPENDNLLLTNPAAVDTSKDSFFTDARKAIRTSVGSGPRHESILRNVEGEMAEMYDSLRSMIAKGEEFELYEWLRHHVLVMTTNSIYGPHNPFQEQAMVDAFWAFNNSAIPMLAIPNALLPYVTRQGYQGRERMVSAFLKYLSSGHHLQAADVIIERQKVMDKYSVAMEDRARIESMNCIAILENTIPSAFWTLFNTITRPELLKEVRVAAHEYVQRGSTPEEPLKINLTHIRHDPLLYAVVNETIRCISNSQEARYVHDEDVVLQSGYRLQKNSLVLMPSRRIHMSSDQFRPTATTQDVGMFDHTRFLKSMGKERKQTVSFTPTGYRGFGAGDTLCPGRHLATAEVLGILAMFVVAFDVEELDEGTPGMTFDQLSLGFPRPDREVWIKIKERDP